MKVADEVLQEWKKNGAFEKSLELREGAPEFIFFEGPPSANGMPGIHHVMARSIKDAVCRYKTQTGYKVRRRAGWDTHGLPVELGVEKKLGITKEDIGRKISVEEYIRHFEPLLKQGKDILHVTLSSGLTGTYNSACIAREELAEQYPQQKIYIVDSLGASSGYGMMMETLADLRGAGKTIDELYAWIENNKLQLHHWFFSTDLSFYIRGGRISRAAGMAGNVLHICPLLDMDRQGHLEPREKVRGKSNVMKRIVEKMESCAQGGTSYNGRCYICHSVCRQDAETVAAMVEERFPALKGKVEIFPIGTTIGSHTGPGTVALFFWGNQRNH